MMLEKIEVLVVALSILIIFYLVIHWGSGGNKKSSESPKIRNYLYGVRILIIVIALVTVILWTFI